MQNHLDDPITFIKTRINTKLAPIELIIQDDSAKHIGHAGAAEGGHFSITVVASAFVDKSQVERHRLIYQALADAMQAGIHALAINAYTPEEFNQQKKS